jgi:hypothetical protein
LRTRLQIDLNAADARAMIIQDPAIYMARNMVMMVLAVQTEASGRSCPSRVPVTYAGADLQLSGTALTNASPDLHYQPIYLLEYDMMRSMFTPLQFQSDAVSSLFRMRMKARGSANIDSHIHLSHPRRI